MPASAQGHFSASACNIGSTIRRNSVSSRATSFTFSSAPQLTSTQQEESELFSETDAPPVERAARMSIEPRLEFVFEINIRLGEQLRKFGPLPKGGQQGFADVIEGEIRGPRLSGRVLPGTGGDYPHIWADGTFEFDATYLLEATDGSLIRIRNHGYRHAAPEIAKRLSDRSPPIGANYIDPTSYYLRVNPRFDVAIGPHDWLTRTVIIGTGERLGPHTLFRYWAVF
jgi:hypothetical protein